MVEVTVGLLGLANPHVSIINSLQLTTLFGG